jgi:hypothetical protein
MSLIQNTAAVVLPAHEGFAAALFAASTPFGLEGTCMSLLGRYSSLSLT